MLVRYHRHLCCAANVCVCACVANQLVDCSQLQTTGVYRMSSSETHLPRIQYPYDAAAATQQELQLLRTPQPRFFVKTTRRVDLEHIPLPAPNSSLAFQRAHNGFLSACTCQYATQESDVARLVASETAELLAFAQNPHAISGADNSLKPRSIGIWVLVLGQQQFHMNCLQKQVLDASAHWAKSIAREARITVLGGDDVHNFYALVRPDRLQELERTRRTKTNTHEVCVCVRWANSDRRGAEKGCTCSETVMRQERTVFNTVLALQGRVYELCYSLSYDHLPPAVVRRVFEEYVEEDAFARNLKVACLQFESHIMGTPSVNIRMQTGAKNDVLTYSDHMVRVCDRTVQPGKRLSSPSCFHGAILCFSNCKENVTKFMQCARNEAEGMWVPNCDVEAHFGLHLCSTQAVRMSLGNAVSLYGALNVDCMPIQEPNTSIWSFYSAVRPVDEALLLQFALYPCGPENVLPDCRTLWRGGSFVLRQTSMLYKKVVGADSAQEWSSCTTKPLQSLASVYDGAAFPTADAFLSVALKLSDSPQKNSIGDALEVVLGCDNCDEFRNLLLSGAATLGLSAPLNHLFTYCKDSIPPKATAALNGQSQHSAASQRALSKSLHITSGAALRHFQEVSLLKHQRTSSDVDARLVRTATYLQRVLDVLQLVEFAHVLLEGSLTHEESHKSGNLEQQCERVLAFIIEATGAVCTTAVGLNLAKAIEPMCVYSAEEEEDARVLRAVSILVSFISKIHSLWTINGAPSSIFVVAQGAAGVAVYNALQYTLHTVDELCKLCIDAQPVIFLLENVDGHSIRIAALSAQK